MIISINKQLTKILSKEQPMGLSTGIPELDESIHGYQKGKLITVAAVSGTGKTSFMCDGIITAANTVPVGVFSIEMGTRSIVDRMVYNIAGLNYHRCKKSRTKSEEQLVEDAKSKLDSSNFNSKDKCLAPFNPTPLLSLSATMYMLSKC